MIAPAATRGAPRRRARRVAAAVVAALTLAMSGCTGAPTADESYRIARAHNLVFREAVATVLVHLYDSVWQVQEYGDEPTPCASGYAFAMHRTTPEGWTLDADGRTTGERLAEWLRTRGWTATEVQADERAVVVRAANAAVGIASLEIEIRDGGGSADAIGVGATTECFEGDLDQILAVLHPDGRSTPPPVDEPAGTTPSFGTAEVP